MQYRTHVNYTTHTVFLYTIPGDIYIVPTHYSTKSLGTLDYTTIHVHISITQRIVFTGTGETQSRGFWGLKLKVPVLSGV